MNKWSTLELRSHFNHVDRDGNGRIDLKEFQVLLKKLGMTRSEQVTRHAFRAIDTDDSGSIDFDEFASWWGNNQHSSHDPEQSSDVLRD
jgi:Ca2+-binding EF-hand superfamily protein